MFEEEDSCWDAQYAGGFNNEFDLEASVDYCIGDIANAGYIGQLEAEDIGATVIEKGICCKSDDQQSSLQYLGSNQMSGTDSYAQNLKVQEPYVKIQGDVATVYYMQMPIYPMLNQQAKPTGTSSKRENNTILKPIFTKFKKLLKKHKQLKHFFDHRAYKENKVSLMDFELFSYVQLMGLWQELHNILNKEIYNLSQPKANYTDIRREAYVEYVTRIFQTMNMGANYVQRMKNLYSNRKHKTQLEQIEQFRVEIARLNHLPTN